MTPRMRFGVGLLEFDSLLQHALARELRNLTVPQFPHLSAERTTGEVEKLITSIAQNRAWYLASFSNG